MNLVKIFAHKWLIDNGFANNPEIQEIVITFANEIDNMLIDEEEHEQN
jgi:hypothetical protein